MLFKVDTFSASRKAKFFQYILHNSAPNWINSILGLFVLIRRHFSSLIKKSKKVSKTHFWLIFLKKKMGNFDQSSALNTHTMERVKIKRKQL